MQVSSNGIALIKKFEGCRLTAYQDSVGVWTIGYGLTNACKSITGLTVAKGVTITQTQAENYLTKVLNAKYVPLVAKYSKYNFNQNQIDALVSFAYNIGSINGLTANGARSISEISSHFTAYNKAGGKVLSGLTKRRAAEKALFDTAVSSSGFYTKYTGTSSSIVEALKAVGESDTSLTHRKAIAAASGIKDYTGSATNNMEMLTLLKAGRLKKA